MKKIKFLTLTAFVFLLCGIIVGQDPDNKNNKDKTVRSNATVNPTSLGMELSIPLGTMPGRAGNSLPITLNYSSKLWRIDTFKVFGTEYTHPFYSDDADSGWTTSLQAPYLEDTSIIKRIQPAASPTPPFELPPLPSPPGPPMISCTATWFNGVRYWVDSTCSCRVGPTGTLYLIAGSCSHPPPNQQLVTTETDARYIIPKKTLHLPDGSTRELVSSLNAILVDSNNPLPPQTTYFSIDGSNLRLEILGDRQVLFMPNGSRYEFREEITATSSKYVVDNFDVKGNKLVYEFARDPNRPGDMEAFVRRGQWRDSMGRTIAPPKPPIDPNNYRKITTGDVEYSIPTMPNNQMSYIFKWRRLEDAFAKPIYVKKYLRELFSDVGIYEADGEQFNPVILKEVLLPNNTSYQFLYNERGEIEKIIHPTGTVEEFTYGIVPPFSHSPFSGLSLQGNRGVLSRTLKPDNNPTNEMNWTYQVLQSPYRIITTNPDSSSNDRRLFVGSAGITTVPRLPTQLAGKSYEERSYNTAGTLVSRALTKWAGFSTTGSGGGCNGFCGGDGGGGIDPNSNLTSSGGSPAPYVVAYPRAEKKISIIFEGYETLAKMSETEYDSNPNPFHFAQMNSKRTRNYDFVPLDINEAESSSLTALQGYFSSDKLLNSAETDYLYNASYLANGIASLPIEQRNKDKSGNVITKTQTVYDNYTASTQYPYSSPIEPQGGVGASYDCGVTGATCWQDPNTAYRGNATTTRVLNLDTNTWIESHVQYDQFGNAVKARDPVGNETTTAFASTYKYAYPTSVVTPAPDPNGVTGTNQTSTVSTTYDFNTGLPLTVTDDFGQTVQTEYNDPLLRPTRTFGVNFTAPETQTIYDDTARTVKVRKQLDAVNWDEATTFMDSLGRAVKTQAKDSQGDVFVETHYDNMGRVDRVTNPYRTGDTVLWSKTRFDELGRAVETFAPATLADITANNNLVSLGVTSFGISTVSNYVGTVVTTTDASNRKGRSITNALGQLVRVDEPTGISASADADLGTLDNPIQPTFYKYNAQGKMVEVTQGVQKRWFKYDSLGRLVRVRQPEQEVNTALNLADAYNASGQWTAAFSYDVLGNLLTATDAKGTVITNTYDNASRVKARTYSNEPAGITTPAVSFFYDGKGLTQQQSPNYAKGKLTKVTSSVSTTENMTFDNFGRLTRSRQITDGVVYGDDAHPMTYSYNLSGALIEQKYPSGRVVKNEFESDGDLMRVFGKAIATATEKTYANAFSYTASGGISQMRLGNGRWETAKFNTRLQVTELGLGASSVDAGTWKVNYDYGELNTDGSVNTSKNTGNIAKQTLSFNGLPNPLVQAYKYDSLYRLTETKETPNGSSTVNWRQNWTYDRYGNRTGFTQNIAGNTAVTNPTVDTNTNRFVTAGTNFQYDLNGNLTRDAESRQFTFNGDNKQTIVRDAVGNIIGQYFFDGEGKRVKKKVYDPNNPAVVIEETIFVYSSGKLVAEYSTQLSQYPTTSYTTTDHLGSPRVITDQLGQVKSRRDFTPFGEDLYTGVGNRSASSGYGSMDNVRQKFTGYQKDTETSLDFAEARMYENRFGRFTAVDPLLASGELARPRSWNRYVYSYNNPLSYIDPSGMVVDDWYVRDDGKIEVYRTTDSFDRFFVFDENSKQYTLKGQLNKNAAGLVEFPTSGYGFTDYNPGESGGTDSVTGENVGQGDHWVKPVVAAALFGFTNQARNDLGVTIALNDMSSSSGSDPWDAKYRRYDKKRKLTWDGHHFGHGHDGNRTGLDIDWRYVDSNGNSQKGVFKTRSTLFDLKLNQAIYALAVKWGFTENYTGKNTPILGVTRAGGHDDHGHFGYNETKIKVTTLNFDRKQPYLDLSTYTMRCYVSNCVGRKW